MRGQGWFRTIGLVTRLARERQFDVIHTHLTRATYFGYFAGLARRVPVVSTVHIANHDVIYKRVARKHNRLVAVSDFVRGMLHGRGIASRFIDTVHNGTDFADFEISPPDGVYDEFGIPRERRLIGLIGRVCREKGHLTLVDAMTDVKRRMPDTHVVFVGRVEETFEPILHRSIADRDLQDRITFTGSRADVPRLIDACEFTTMPSHIETFGIAAIEAMARRRAVVASRVGGLPEIVRHGQTGLLVDLRADDLADAICYLLDHRDEREQMGSRGRQTVEEKFTLNQMVGRLERVYRRAAQLG